MAPEGAPSVLDVVLDDVGFSAMEPFGGPMVELIPHAVSRQSGYVASITRLRAELARWLWDLSKTALTAPTAHRPDSRPPCARVSSLVKHRSLVILRLQVPLAR